MNLPLFFRPISIISSILFWWRYIFPVVKPPLFLVFHSACNISRCRRHRSPIRRWNSSVPLKPRVRETGTIGSQEFTAINNIIKREKEEDNSNNNNKQVDNENGQLLRGIEEPRHTHKKKCRTISLLLIAKWPFGLGSQNHVKTWLGVRSRRGRCC